VLTRNRSSSQFPGNLAAGSTKTFTAQLLFRDHQNAILQTVLSNSVAADCDAS